MIGHPAVGSEVIHALEPQEIKETGNENGCTAAGKATKNCQHHKPTNRAGSGRSMGGIACWMKRVKCCWNKGWAQPFQSAKRVATAPLVKHLKQTCCALIY